MRCTTYCTAASYNLGALLHHLQKEGSAQSYRDFLHAQLRHGDTLRGDILYFSYGAVVCWGLTKEEERAVLKGLRKFEVEPISQPEIDEFTYAYNDKMRIEEDEIFLQNKAILTKVAISYGLAQSVKLTSFEEIIQKTIEDTKRIPESLSRRGKVSLSRREISRKVGELFIERSFINLHTEILDVPEFFWEYSELEPFYQRTSHYLDIHRRVEVLNRRLSVVHELFEILRFELNHQYTSRLEWIIIILILIEVLIALLRDVFHLI